MSRYTASPFGIIPETTSELSNFRYKTTSDGKEQNSLFSSSHTFGSEYYSGERFTSVEDPDYDLLSTANIIEQLKDIPSMRLKYSDFAYCKDFGVYPNNRLIICRKFFAGVGDDLTKRGVGSIEDSKLSKGAPLVTLVSWFDEASLPVAIDFGVDWVDAEGSFRGVLNNMGKDIGLDKIGIQLGDVATKGFNFLPLPGIFEPFTKKIINKVFGTDINPNTVSGAPNLIKEAKQRKLISDDQTGSGLIGKISVTVKCSWEQKFIMGLDPTNVYFDILRTILEFGGESGTFYSGGKLGDVVNKFLGILKDPIGFIQDVINSIFAAIKDMVTKIKTLIKSFFDSAKLKKSTSSEGEADAERLKAAEEADSKPGAKGGLAEAERKRQKDVATAKEDKAVTDSGKEQDKLTNTANKLLDNLFDLVAIGTGGLADKYKHVLLGIVSALSGGPSTPWHVTIGNPMKPIFSSGDLWTSGIKLTLGPTLAFNDLPSNIDIEFTLTSGRNYGIDEIFRKLSTGDIRTVSKSAPSFYNNEGETEEDAIKGSGSPVTDNKDDQTLQPFEINAQSRVDSTNAVGSVSTNGAQINPDVNSSAINSPIQQNQLTANPSLGNPSALTSGSPNFNLDLAGGAAGGLPGAGGLPDLPGGVPGLPGGVPGVPGGVPGLPGGPIPSQNATIAGLEGFGTNNPLGSLGETTRVEQLIDKSKSANSSGGFGPQAGGFGNFSLLV